MSDESTMEDTQDATTELYDAIGEAAEELKAAQALLSPDDDAFTPPAVQEARNIIEGVRTDLADTALANYNDTEYAEDNA